MERRRRKWRTWSGAFVTSLMPPFNLALLREKLALQAMSMTTTTTIKATLRCYYRRDVTAAEVNDPALTTMPRPQQQQKQ